MLLPNFSTPHSHPGSLDSASTPEAFALREAELGTGSLTCTDHGTLGAAYETYRIAKEGPQGFKNWKKLTPVIGLEAYFRDDDCPILTKAGVQRTHTVPRGSNKDEWRARYPQGTFLDYHKYFHLTLHFMDHASYRCAVRLLSRADARAEKHGSERKPLFAWSDLEELAALNTTATTSCLIGMVSRHVAFKDISAGPEIAEAYLDRLHHLFGDKFYAEVFPHVCDRNWIKGVFVTTGDGQTHKYHFDKWLRTVDKQGSVREVRASDLAADRTATSQRLTGVKNRTVWADCDLEISSVKAEEGYVQNEVTPRAPGGDLQWGANLFAMMMAARKKIPILVSDDSHYATRGDAVVQDVRLAQQTPPWRMAPGYHRMSSGEALQHFRERHSISQRVFEGWVDNSKAWVDRFKGFEFDKTPQIPTKFYPADSLSHTRALILKHGRLRFDDPRYVKRLTTEVELLHKNGKIDLLPYFFIYEEICEFYEHNDWLPGPGRGSAAGLYLSYLLKITHVDPIEYGLFLERFITADRIQSGKLPDIDQDLPDRDPLVGWETDVVEFKAEDGTLHVVPEQMKFNTDMGWMTIRDAVAKGADLKPWWLEKTT